jgi:hypothetical protein
MEKKLWKNKKIKRSLGRAGMYLSQPARVDHMCNIKVGRKKKENFTRWEFRILVQERAMTIGH